MRNWCLNWAEHAANGGGEILKTRHSNDGNA